VLTLETLTSDSAQKVKIPKVVALGGGGGEWQDLCRAPDYSKPGVVQLLVLGYLPVITQKRIARVLVVTHPFWPTQD
jgi:hypothetical protein